MDANEGKIVFVGLMPHAPVLIPEVGQGREREAGQVVDAMVELSRRMMECQPDRLVLISPHSPRQRGRFGIWIDPRIAGDLGRFRAQEVQINVPTDLTFAEALGKEACWEIRGEALDHGASVPLYFLTKGGWDGPTTLLSLNYPGDGGLVELGRAIAEVTGKLGGTTAVIASGDMSHALIPGAPCGFLPRAKEFDARFVELIKSRHYQEVQAIDPVLQELASEDVVDSTVIGAASVDWAASGAEFLAYQCPFGVGYSVAVLFADE